MTTAVFFGLICVLGALVFIFISINELKLGKYSSKFLASVFTLVIYFSIATNNVFPSVQSIWIKWTIPILFIVFIIFMGIRVWQNRNEEIKSIFEASWKLAIVIVLMIIARFLFSLH